MDFMGNYYSWINKFKKHEIQILFSIFTSKSTKLQPKEVLKD